MFTAYLAFDMLLTLFVESMRKFAAERLSVALVLLLRSPGVLQLTQTVSLSPAQH